MRLFLGMLSVFPLSLSPLVAQQQDRESRPRIAFEEVLRREDANKDGEVSRSEFQAPARLFQKLDRNGDGVLRKDDFDGDPGGSGNAKRADNRVPDDLDVRRDVVYGKGGQRDLKMHIVLSNDKTAGPHPVFVWIHGGGWQGGTKDGGISQVAPLVRRGFVGATIEYRLTGEAPFPAQIEDCKCAIRFLRANAATYNLDPQRIAVGGSSAGGHLAALLGTSAGVTELEGNGGWPDQPSGVQAVLDLYGPTDFEQFVTTKDYEGHNRDGSPESKLLGGGEVLVNPDGIKRVNPISYIDKEDPTFLIIHGDSDRTVPPNQSESLHAALKSAGVPSTLHLIEGAGHGGPEFSQPEINQMRTDFLLQLLSKPVSTQATP